MGGTASKSQRGRGAVGSAADREAYARLPHGGTAARPSTEAATSLRGRGSAKVKKIAKTKQAGHSTRERSNQTAGKPSTRPGTPGAAARLAASPSPHSTTFTVSTANSAHRHNVRDSASSSSVEYNDVVDPPTPLNRIYNPHRRMSDHVTHRQSLSQPYLTEDERRIADAEKILEEIAKEYAAKRAAGLVPTKPVPARTLLWEELAKKSTQAGRRGECIFGRDTDNICGCTTYKKKRVPGQENRGGVCECCQHGAVWHRLVGGTMARSSSRMSRSIIGVNSTMASNTSGVRVSRLESTTSQYVPSEARSSAYEYDSDDYDEDEDDDDAIANEMAMPSSFHPAQPSSPQTSQANDGSSRGGLDRLSMLSVGSSYGFPSRASATNSLGALLQAIQRYREMGLDEDEIEARIRSDLPSMPRQSSIAAQSETSQVDV